MRVAVRALRRRLHDYYAGAGAARRGVRSTFPRADTGWSAIPREVAPAPTEHAPGTRWPALAVTPACTAPAHSVAACAPSFRLPSAAKPMAAPQWAIGSHRAAGRVGRRSTGILWLNRPTPAARSGRGRDRAQPALVGNHRLQPAAHARARRRLHVHARRSAARAACSSMRDRAINSSEELRIFLAREPIHRDRARPALHLDAPEEHDDWHGVGAAARESPRARRSKYARATICRSTTCRSTTSFTSARCRDSARWPGTTSCSLGIGTTSSRPRSATS